MNRLVACCLVTTALAIWTASAFASDEVEGDAEAARPFNEQALAAFREGRFADAAGLFQRAYNLYPHPQFRFNMGQAYRRAGMHQRALDEYTNYLLEASQPNPQVFVLIGDCHLRLGHREEANQAFQSYLEDAPDGPHAAEARRAIESGQPPSQGDARPPEAVSNAEAVYDRADARYEAGDFRGAATIFEQGARELQMSELLYDAGVAYADAGMWQDAIRVLRSHIEAGGYEDAWAVLGQCYAEQFEFTNAVQAYERYLQADPDGDYAQEARDFIRATTGEGGGGVSREQYQRARAAFRRAHTHFEHNRFGQALRELRTAAQILPHDRSITFNMGRCYAGMRNWSEAQSQFEAYLEGGDEGDAVVAHLHVAECFLEQGGSRREALRHIRIYTQRAESEDLTNEEARMRWARELERRCGPSDGSQHVPAPGQWRAVVSLNAGLRMRS